MTATLITGKTFYAWWSN